MKISRTAWHYRLINKMCENEARNRARHDELESCGYLWLLAKAFFSATMLCIVLAVLAILLIGGPAIVLLTVTGILPYKELPFGFGLMVTTLEFVFGIGMVITYYRIRHPKVAQPKTDGLWTVVKARLGKFCEKIEVV